MSRSPTPASGVPDPYDIRQQLGDELRRTHGPTARTAAVDPTLRSEICFIAQRIVEPIIERAMLFGSVDPAPQVEFKINLGPRLRDGVLPTARGTVFSAVLKKYPDRRFRFFTMVDNYDIRDTKYDIHAHPDRASFGDWINPDDIIVESIRIEQGPPNYT